jgi:hypothetical protein
MKSLITYIPHQIASGCSNIGIGRIILKWILNIEGGESVDWIHITQDRDQWQTLVIMMRTISFVRTRLHGGLERIVRYVTSVTCN